MEDHILLKLAHADRTSTLWIMQRMEEISVIKRQEMEEEFNKEHTLPKRLGRIFAMAFLGRTSNFVPRSDDELYLDSRERTGTSLAQATREYCYHHPEAAERAGVTEAINELHMIWIPKQWEQKLPAQYPQ